MLGNVCTDSEVFVLNSKMFGHTVTLLNGSEHAGLCFTYCIIIDTESLWRCPLNTDWSSHELWHGMQLGMTIIACTLMSSAQEASSTIMTSAECASTFISLTNPSASPCFNSRAQVKLMCPCSGILLMQGPICVCDGRWLEEEALGRIWLHFLCSWQLNHAVDVDPSNVNFLHKQQRNGQSLVTPGAAWFQMSRWRLHKH